MIPDRGPVLRRNMTLAIEPMINLGTHEVDMIGDWQVLTQDRKPSAHFEHTVVGHRRRAGDTDDSLSQAEDRLRLKSRRSRWTA